MRTGYKAGGYTIIEVMIFLIVAGVLMAAALLVFNGRQGRTQFTQGVQEFNSKINDIMNEVSSGYYPSNNDFTCTAGSFGPDFKSGSNGLGTNTDCVFLGKVMQMGPQATNCSEQTNINECKDYTVYVLAGLRKSAGKEVTSLADSKPRLVFPDNIDTDSPDLRQSDRTPWNLRITGVYEQRSGITSLIGAFGFVSSFPGYGGQNNSDLISGSQSFDLVAIDGSVLGQSPDSLQSLVHNLTDASRNPDRVIVCLESGTTSPARPAAITIGGDGRQLSTETSFDSSVPAECKI